MRGAPASCHVSDGHPPPHWPFPPPPAPQGSATATATAAPAFQKTFQKATAALAGLHAARADPFLKAVVALVLSRLVSRSLSLVPLGGLRLREGDMAWVGVGRDPTPTPNPTPCG